jgi:hypothetical protein
VESHRFPEQTEQRLSHILSPVESAGLGVGVIGTIVLFILAAACHDFTILKEGQGAFLEFPAGCAMRLAIAGAWSLITLGNVLLTLVFEGFDEHRFPRMLARISLYGTPVAIVVSALIGPA